MQLDGNTNEVLQMLYILLTDKIHFDFPAPHKYKPILRDILLDCPKSEGTPYSEYKRKIFELVPPGGC